jgi:hypothetical protein
VTAALVVEVLALVLVIGAGWFWFDSLRAREAAVGMARDACAADGVLLLDDTVALMKLRLARDERGAVALMRVYRFEFTDTGNNRLEGSVALLGATVQTLYLEAHIGANEPQRAPWAQEERRGSGPGDMAT